MKAIPSMAVLRSGDLNGPGSTNNPYRYGGQEGYYYEKLALEYIRARWRDMLKAGWVSRDPSAVEGGDLNLYRYVRNRAVVAADPTGLDTCYSGGPCGPWCSCCVHTNGTCDPKNCCTTAYGGCLALCNALLNILCPNHIVTGSICSTIAQVGCGRWCKDATNMKTVYDGCHNCKQTSLQCSVCCNDIRNAGGAEIGFEYCMEWCDTYTV
jgi:RHS repeat-associated protein